MHSAGREGELFVFVCVSYLESKYIFIKMHCVFQQTCVVCQQLYKPQNSQQVVVFFLGPLAARFQSQHLSDSPHIPADCPAQCKHPVDIFSMQPIAGPRMFRFSPIVHDEPVCAVHPDLLSLDLLTERTA